VWTALGVSKVACPSQQEQQQDEQRHGIKNTARLLLREFPTVVSLYSEAMVGKWKWQGALSPVHQIASRTRKMSNIWVDIFSIRNDFRYPSNVVDTLLVNSDVSSRCNLTFITDVTDESCRQRLRQDVTRDAENCCSAEIVARISHWWFIMVAHRGISWAKRRQARRVEGGEFSQSRAQPSLKNTERVSRWLISSSSSSSS